MATYDMNALIRRLEAQAESAYAGFSEKLVPGTQLMPMGVRMPALRALAREIARTEDWRSFLDESRAHPVYEIRILHAMVIGAAKCAPDERIALVDSFLPYIDNWAVCDCLCSSLKPGVAERRALFPFACECAESAIEFRKRFGLVLLMSRFREPECLPGIMDIYRRFSHEGYYARMGAAWGLATLWLNAREACLSILEDGLWDPFTHNKAIQKLCESYRVSDSDKALVRTLRRAG